MPDHIGITWDPNLKEGTREEDDYDALKTPVARDTQDYFHPDSPSDEIHGTGPNTQQENGGGPSTATSSISLKSMSEISAHSDTVRRAVSVRASYGQMRGRRHSKSHSMSATRSKPNSEHPVYPDQSFAALGPFRPSSPLRTRSSHPAQNMLYNDVRPNRSPLHGAVTADNTPLSSPGLFELPRSPSAPPTHEEKLHHLQAPKETHVVEIEHDVFSGNKFINNYEVVSELGRGEHGKVKLARNMDNGHHVAVKIVPRYSRFRRLGRLGAPEDRTKREVAILKKARHPHVVSLLEVIDDPNKNKVYLILEYVERGEILWRKKGIHEIIRIMQRRFESEKAGVRIPPEPTEKERYDVELAKRRHEYNEKKIHLPPNLRDWSLEHGDDDHSDLSPSASRNDVPSRSHSHDEFGDDLAGSMYGAYSSDTYRDRKFSIAMSSISHLSSELAWGDDDEHSFVPALTMDEARRTFRDTLLGLEFLHYIGIIHRDIKPANLLVAKDGAVKISDFGVSYLGRPVTEENPENKLTAKDVTALDDEKELARSVGTPAFWAPEVCFEDPSIFGDGQQPKITGALDLWSLGITLYCMIYARLPFYADKRGLHENICTEEVFIPRYRLVPVDTTSPDRPIMHPPSAINSNKRLDFEIKFEEVPDHVRDLIRKLLVKDPAWRMTILEAKQHPWVLEGEDDVSAFFSSPRLPQKVEDILQPDEKEVDRAVVKRSLVERVTATVGKVGNFAGSLLSRAGTLREGRNRSTSTATSSGESTPSPAASTSTVGKIKDSRRHSLKTDEITTQLKATRGDHPLAQSETSSPQESGPTDYFDEELRPRVPDRAVSHADSIRTVRALQRPTIPALHPEGVPDPTFLQTVEHIVEGAATSLNRFANNARYWGERSPSASRQSLDSDIHGAPSVAVSTASATGSIETPEALRSPQEEPRSASRSELRGSIHAPASTDQAFELAQEINTRKLIQESEAVAKAKADAELPPPLLDECPPSPDDETFLQAQPSASTIASSADENSMSINMSNPSFGIPSNASSPPTDHFLSALMGNAEDAMKTSDTVRMVSGKPLEEEQYNVEPEDEYSDDEGLMMPTSRKR